MVVVVILTFLGSNLATGGRTDATSGLHRVGNNVGNTGGIVGYNSNNNAINQLSTYDRLDDGYPAPEKLTEIDNFGVGFAVAHRRTKYSPVRYQHHGNANNFNANAGNNFGNIGRGVGNGFVNRGNNVQDNGQQYHLFSKEFKIFGPEVHENEQPYLSSTGHVISTNNVHIGVPIASRPVPSRRKGYPQNPYPGGVINSRIRVRNINLGAGTGIAAFMSGREGIGNSRFDNSNLLLSTNGVGNGNTGYGNNGKNVGIATGSGTVLSSNTGVGANAFSGAGSFGTNGIGNNKGGYSSTNTGNGIINDAVWNGDFSNSGTRNIGFANGGTNVGTGNVGYDDVGNRGINAGGVGYGRSAGVVSGAQNKVGTGVAKPIITNNHIPAASVANAALVNNAGNVGSKGTNSYKNNRGTVDTQTLAQR